jgi:hypothetical protein
MLTTIYALCDQSGSVRYIGKASNHVRRWVHHIRESRKGKRTHKCNWIRSLLAVGVLPGMKVLMECEGDGFDAERYQIWLARRSALNLTNATDGGEGGTTTHFRGRKHSLESIAKRTQSRLKTLFGIDRVVTAEDVKVPLRLRRDRGLKKGDKHKWAKVTGDLACKIWDRYHADNARLVEIAAEFNIGKSQVWNIVNGSSWKHLGLVKPPRKPHFNSHWRLGKHGYRGIAYDSRSERWIAYIVHSGKRNHIGCFATKEDAARAYDSAARVKFGADAVVNFPTSSS